MCKTKQQWLDIYAAIPQQHLTTQANRMYDSAELFMSIATGMRCFTNVTSIIDLGCGNGRLARPLIEYGYTYYGFDISAWSIHFCKASFFGCNNASFEVLPVTNSFYVTENTVAPEQMTIPTTQYTPSFDLAICFSLFTHLQTIPVAERYLSEIRRVLAPQGQYLTTWWCSNTPDTNAAKTLYRQGDVLRMLTATGDHILDTYDVDGNQWWILTAKA